MNNWKHPTAIIADSVQLGNHVKIYAYSNLYGCSIGDQTQIGSFVEVQKGVSIGNRCKISTHTFICEGVTIQDEVFVGHNVTFCNDAFPKACNEAGELAGENDWVCQNVLVEKSASIGSGSTILPGITIGRGALVGAGSVVTKDVPAFTIVAGNPARPIRSL